MLGTSLDGTKGDLMVLGSNQEVKMLEGVCGWWLEVSSLYSCLDLSWSLRHRDRPEKSSHFLPINPALWQRSHMTLTPHLSAAQTCPAFNSKRLHLWLRPDRSCSHLGRVPLRSIKDWARTTASVRSKMSSIMSWHHCDSLCKYLIGLYNNVGLKLMNQ